MNDGLILAWYGVQRNGIKSFGISGPDTIDVEVLLLQIPGSACLYFRADLVARIENFAIGLCSMFLICTMRMARASKVYPSPSTPQLQQKKNIIASQPKEIVTSSPPGS